MALKGVVAKAKANAAQGIPELIQVATNREYSENTKKKHIKAGKSGWYRYDVRFSLPVYDGLKYLYDLLAIKKKRAARLSHKTVR